MSGDVVEGSRRSMPTVEWEPPPEGRGERLVFVIGCPRSGTTWLQLLLARHHEVVTSQETHLFSGYLGHPIRIWTRERQRPDDARDVGLTTVLDTEEFQAACRSFANAVFQKIRSRKPGASLLVEKTPSHVRWGCHIHELYPDATFLHVIRDPRDVVCSLRGAAEGWGRTWAPDNLVDATRKWRDSVSEGREIRQRTSRYREIRYEDLQASAAGELARVLEFLGLEADRAFCEIAAEACSIDRLRAGRTATPWETDEPTGFFRKGRARGWQDELRRGEVRVVEHLAGDLMEELGYDRTTAAESRRPLRLVLREGLEWRLERVTARLRRWVRRL